MVKKYEDDIHDAQHRYEDQIEYLKQELKNLKAAHILPNHQQQLNKLKERNELITLRHIESEAILLLIDPSNDRSSKYFLNFGIHSSL